jgi:hypothetical protein
MVSTTLDLQIRRASLAALDRGVRAADLWVRPPAGRDCRNAKRGEIVSRQGRNLLLVVRSLST